MTRQYVTIVIMAIVVAALSSEAFAQCDRIGQTIRETKVYDRTPVYYSGSGWRFGTPIDSLNSGSRVRVCDEKNVGFFFGKKTWYLIELGQNRGWVYSGDLRFASNHSAGGGLSGLFFISTASAASHGDTRTADAAGGDSGVPANTGYLLYGLAFVATLFGMSGKAIFDELDTRRKVPLRASVISRKCIKAFTVAPITFVAFLQGGQFSFQTELSLLIALGLAFQNGFFWQTVLPTESSMVLKPARS